MTDNGPKIHRSLDVNLIIRFLKAEFEVIQAIYIFGSAITSDFTRHSDLDIAVKLRTQIDNISRWRTQEKLAAQINRDVDLVELNRASLVMQFEVVSKGLKVYCADSYEVDLYETLIFSRYLDFNEIRKSIITDIIDRGSIYAH